MGGSAAAARPGLRILAVLCSLAVVGAGSGKSYSETPSWRIALMFFAFVLVSIVFEKILHYIEHHIIHGKMNEVDRMKNAGIIKTIDKAKEELMLMAGSNR